MNRKNSQLAAYAKLAESQGALDEDDALAWREFVRRVQELSQLAEFEGIDIVVEVTY